MWLLSRPRPPPWSPSSPIDFGRVLPAPDDLEPPPPPPALPDFEDLAPPPPPAAEDPPWVPESYLEKGTMDSPPRPNPDLFAMVLLVEPLPTIMALRVQLCPSIGRGWDGERCRGPLTSSPPVACPLSLLSQWWPSTPTRGRRTTSSPSSPAPSSSSHGGTRTAGARASWARKWVSSPAITWSPFERRGRAVFPPPKSPNPDHPEQGSALPFNVGFAQLGFRTAQPLRG